MSVINFISKASLTPKVRVSVICTGACGTSPVKGYTVAAAAAAFAASARCVGKIGSKWRLLQ